MATKDKVFSSKIKYGGFFNFKEFYQFCHDWLSEEEGFKVSEEKYVEKLAGDSKDIEVEWKCVKSVTDYFKFEIGVGIKGNGLKKVEMVKEGVKVETNDGSVELSVKGTLVKDYKGTFEKNAWNTFTRGIYEKWVIPSGISAMKSNLAGTCDGFLGQAKAYLDLEGKK